MNYLKHFLAALLFSLSTAAFASSNYHCEIKWDPITFQIEEMLSHSDLIVEEGFTATIIFKVNADKKIEIRLIDSPNEEVNSFLKRRLENQKLYGNSWDVKKIYELPIKVQATR